MEHATNIVTALKQVFPLQRSVAFFKEQMYSLLELLTSPSSSSVEVRDSQQIQSRVRALEILYKSLVSLSSISRFNILLSDLHSSPVSSLISDVYILKVCNQPASSEGP